MQVTIRDDPDNWRKWGDLVKEWIVNRSAWPRDTAAMQAQMNSAGIDGSIPGPNRAVQFVPYNDSDGPLVFPLPTMTQVATAEQKLADIAAKPPGQRRYPLPSYYAVAFGGSAMAELGIEELRALARRRLGEYTILECQ